MNLQESIVTTTLDVFSGMLFMTATPQEAVEPGMTHLNSISGIIGFGGRAKGMLAVHTPEEVAKKCCIDTRATYALWEYLQGKVNQRTWRLDQAIMPILSSGCPEK